MVDRIKALCKAQNTSVTKLEAFLGFGNGTIGKWRNAKGAPPIDRLQKVADALGVTAHYLLTGENEKKPVTEANLTDEQQELVKLFDSASPELRAAALAVLRAANGEK